MEPYNIKLETQNMQSAEANISDQIGAIITSQTMIDQPAMQTVMRDLRSVWYKMRYVILLLPRHKEQATNELKHWDLWGPLIICLFFSVTLSLVSSNDKIEDFINVFIIFWIGGFIVALNTKLLGNKGSLFQSLSALGYCLLPLAAFGTIVSCLHNVMWLWLKLVLTLVALAWSTVACIIVHSLILPPEKKWLSSYPIFLFYVFLSWYAIVV